MKDSILEEIWAVKDRIGAKYRGNIRKFMNDLREQRKSSPLAAGSPGKSKSRRPSRKSV